MLSIGGGPFKEYKVELLFADAEGDERDYTLVGANVIDGVAHNIDLQIGTGTYPDSVSSDGDALECTDNAKADVAILDRLVSKAGAKK